MFGYNLYGDQGGRRKRPGNSSGMLLDFFQGFWPIEMLTASDKPSF